MTIGRHKTGVFAAVAVLLSTNYWFAIVRPRQMNCAPGEICHVDSPAMRVNRTVFWVSVAIYVAAVVFTYGVPLWIVSEP